MKKGWTGTVTGLGPMAWLLIILGSAVLVTMFVMQKMSENEAALSSRTGPGGSDSFKMEQRLQLLEERVSRLESEASKQRQPQQP